MGWELIQNKDSLPRSIAGKSVYRLEVEGDGYNLGTGDGEVCCWEKQSQAD